MIVDAYVINGKENMRKLTTEGFIKKAREVHGDEYDYSKVEYINSHSKVCIICKEHGEFWQTPNTHLQGSGCKMCYGYMQLTLEEWIKRANLVHNNKYTYNKTKCPSKNTEKVIITCPIHGDFTQRASGHLQGNGCPKCGKASMREKQKMPLTTFIERCNEIHKNFYDYSKVEYDSVLDKIKIVCPIHGVFEQTASAHMRGQGCPICGRKKLYDKIRLSNEEFIKKAKSIHGNTYDYSLVNYIDYDTHVKIICPIHGVFEQTPDSHLQGKGCLKCSHSMSKAEDEIVAFIKSKNPNIKIEQRVRNIISPYEIDILLPDLNIAIEYNGILWHSTKFNKNKKRHINKLNKCNEKGIKLIQIFEDEWLNKKEIVYNKISHLCHLENKTKVYARKCVVKEIDKITSNFFLEKNHIQGYCASSICLGCFSENNLIGVMSFKIIKENEWELVRFATDIKYTCCGIGGKMFNFFKTKYKPSKVKSFADRRWTINEKENVYTKMGFTLSSINAPDYRYYKPNINERIHKFNFRKKILLKKYGNIVNDKMTESEMAATIGYFKVYDCGLLKYVWENLEN